MNGILHVDVPQGEASLPTSGLAHYLRVTPDVPKSFGSLYVVLSSFLHSPSLLFFLSLPHGLLTELIEIGL